MVASAGVGLRTIRTGGLDRGPAAWRSRVGRLVVCLMVVVLVCLASKRRQQSSPGLLMIEKQKEFKKYHNEKRIFGTPEWLLTAVHKGIAKRRNKCLWYSCESIFIATYWWFWLARMRNRRWRPTAPLRTQQFRPLLRRWWRCLLS